MLLALYGLVCLAMLLRLAVDRRRISHPHERVNTVQDASAAATGIRIVESASCRVPFTFGWLKPTIVLPSNWRRWSRNQLGVVLTHEFAHVQNRDFLFQILSAVHRCLFWFSPLRWWLGRRLVSLAEHAGDDAVLRAGHDAVEYSDWLYWFFGRGSYGRWGTPLISVAGARPATRRIDWVLDPGPKVVSASGCGEQQIAGLLPRCRSSDLLGPGAGRSGSTADYSSWPGLRPGVRSTRALGQCRSSSRALPRSLGACGSDVEAKARRTRPKERPSSVLCSRPACGPVR